MRLAQGVIILYMKVELCSRRVGKEDISYIPSMFDVG